MKKFIALMLALVMVMSLTGCLSGNVGIVFNENGSGKVATSMYIADSFLKEMGKTPEEAFADQDGTIKKKDINGERTPALKRRSPSPMCRSSKSF